MPLRSQRTFGATNGLWRFASGPQPLPGTDPTASQFALHPDCGFTDVLGFCSLFALYKTKVYTLTKTENK